MTEIDWERFLQLVRFHRIQGLAWKALVDADLPAGTASALSADAKEIAAANLKAAAECARIRTDFDRARIDVLFVKGLTLSALAYGDPFIKMSSDIDILVGRQDVGAAASLLGKMGYRPVMPADATVQAIEKWHARNKESAWLDHTTGAYVELHTGLANNSRLIAAIGMASPRQCVDISPGLELPTLSTEDLVTYLFVHGASSAWFRLKWLSDLCALIDAEGPEETEELYCRAISKGAGRTPAQALLLAEQVFGLSLTPWLHDEIRKDATSRLLASAALRAMSTIEEPTSRFGGTLLFHLTQPLLIPGWGFALNEVSRQVQDIARRRLWFS